MVTQSSIGNNARGVTSYCGKYIWSFDKKKRIKRMKCIYRYDLEKKLIAKYRNSREASEMAEFSQSKIESGVYANSRTTGFIWKKK